MQSAARHVTSVTLELGGKSPFVVLSDADGLEALRAYFRVKTVTAKL
jgi:acyl-CoA reductase-like NAD-dependent aldehyde dehydrogenase